MKLCRFGTVGEEKPGLIDAEGRLRDLSGLYRDIDQTVLCPEGLAKLAEVEIRSLPLVEGEPRFGVPFIGVGKFIGIGLNYSDHAAESGMKVPSEPILQTSHYAL